MSNQSRDGEDQEFVQLFQRFLQDDFSESDATLLQTLVACLKARPERCTARLHVVGLGNATPIVHVCKHIWNMNGVEVLRLLIEHKANVNDGNVLSFVARWDKSGTTALQMLLEAKADVNARDDDGWTALMAAAYLGRARNVQALLEAKADTSARNSATPSRDKHLADKTAWEMACDVTSSTWWRHRVIEELAPLLAPVAPPAPPAPRVDLEAIALVSARTSEFSANSTTAADGDARAS